MDEKEITTLTTAPFGVDEAGQAVTEYTLRRGDVELSILDWGCTLRRLLVPDRSGRPVDVLLGCASMADCLRDNTFLGQTIGRIANRVEDSRFALNGKEYRLEPNEGKNHLHGVWARQVFAAESIPQGLALHYCSPDGEEGCPGQVDFTLRVTLPGKGAVRLEYLAETTATTPLNLTNHAYFNLAGEGLILDHTLWLGAEHFCEARPDSCPTGRLLPVAGTPLDFTAPRTLGQGLAAPNEQMALMHGYDHNFVLDRKGPDGLSARLACPRSGIQMSVYTTQPGMQLYSGNWLQNSPAPGKDGSPLRQNQGVALETQHFPCSLSHPEFPSILLEPGEQFCQVTTLQFDIV